MRKRVLVVDDLVEVAARIGDQLRMYFDVDTATSGIEALRKFGTCRYDGLVVDVQLEAGMSGLELLSKIRERDRDVPVLIISATEHSDDVARSAVELGATFCQKPVTSETMRKIFATE